MGDYLPFDQPVPFSSDGKYAEASLRAIGDPTRVGVYLRGDRYVKSRMSDNDDQSVAAKHRDRAT